MVTSLQLVQALGLTYKQLIILGVVSIWSLIWKGIALWKSARKRHLVWFVVLLIVNTAGILEILYIFLFSKIKLDERKEKPKSRRR